jgi:UDP-galactopyranose mutase
VPILPVGASESEAVKAQKDLLDDLLRGHAGEEIIFWYYTPMALRFSDHVKADLCVYDCMDELSGFAGAPPQLKKLEAQLLKQSDLVFTGGRSLFEAKRHAHSNIHAMPSSIDKEHFAKARVEGGPEPLDQTRLQKPRVGYFGVIDERIDLGLVERVAELRPSWEFVYLGPVAKISVENLPRRHNIHWLGQRGYADLPSYLGGWQAGFMPFALNEATHFISPTKTPEFLAAGVPVVSTPIADVVRPYGEMGLVEIAADPLDAVAKLETIFNRPQQPWLDRVDEHLSDMSWDRTWAAMDTLMHRHWEGLPANDVFLPSSARGGSGSHV